MGLPLASMRESGSDEEERGDGCQGGTAVGQVKNEFCSKSEIE